MIGFLQLLGVVSIFVLPLQVVLADVAPPPVDGATPNAIGAVILGLAVFAIAIVVASVLVIRRIRKNRTPKGDA
ncbi:MAG: hypothetical protein JXA21_11230 [Anaerolineae bacterium]|nr:hypothetical protein [Anaerolineae bacterium]